MSKLVSAVWTVVLVFTVSCGSDGDEKGQNSGSDALASDTYSETSSDVSSGGNNNNLTYTCQKPGSFIGICVDPNVEPYCTEHQLPTQEALDQQKNACIQMKKTWTDGSMCPKEAWCGGCLLDLGEKGCSMGWFRQHCDIGKEYCPAGWVE